MNNKIDIILSHTCPLKYEPTEVFMKGIDQSDIDKSMERFLDKVYKDLHLSEIVMHTANKSDDKYQKIKKYMQRLEDVTKKACKHDKINLIKKYYYKI